MLRGELTNTSTHMYENVTRACTRDPAYGPFHLYNYGVFFLLDTRLSLTAFPSTTTPPFPHPPSLLLLHYRHDPLPK